MKQSGTILLVDDDPAILQMVGDRLQMEGYTLVTASRGEQALEKLRSLIPNLIILDISMPGLGGLGFLNHLTDVSPRPTCPIMIFTGRHELAPFFADDTVSVFLPKTTHPEIFIQKVHELVARHQSQLAHHVHLIPGITPKKLLLVEDDFGLRDHLSRFFCRSGFEVEPLDGGHSLLETATRGRPDLILIKYLLPHHNGPELAEQLGNHPPTQKIPIVLYDETGIHTGLWKHPFVKSLVSSTKDYILLKAVSDILGLPSFSPALT
jgi:CheY-like chemotaxis protein